MIGLMIEFKNVKGLPPDVMRSVLIVRPDGVAFGLLLVQSGLV